MVLGTVEWFNNAEGFGFLLQENGNFVFCPRYAILGQGVRPMSEGDHVTFDVVKGPRGLEAENVIRI